MKNIFDFDKSSKKIIIGSSLNDVDIFLKQQIKNNKDKLLVNFEECTILTLAKQIILNSGLNNFIFISDELASLLMDSFLSTSKNYDDKNMLYNAIPRECLSINTSKMIYESIKRVEFCSYNSNFPHKQLIKDFDNYLSDESYIYLTSYGIIQKAISILNETKIKDILLFGDDISLILLPNFQDKLSYLESMFLETLKKYYSLKEITYLELDKNINEIYEVCAYGFASEINFIVDKINKENINVNDVAIYTSDNSYENLIKAILEFNHIKYRFVNGENSLTNEVISLINKIFNFLLDHFSIKHLSRIYDSPILTYSIKNKESGEDEIISYTNIPRLKYLLADKNALLKDIEDARNWNENQKNFLLDLLNLKNCSDLLSFYSTLLNFIFKYVNPHHINLIKDELISRISFFEILNKKKSYSFEEIINISFNIISNIKIKKKVNKEDSEILIYNLKNSHYLTKKYNFFVGLTASQMDSKSYDSPLINDDTLEDIAVKGYYLPLSKNVNFENEQSIESLIESLKCNSIYLIYSEFDSVDFKKIAKWSKLYSINVKKLLNYGYLNNKINKDDFNGKLDFKLLDDSLMNKVVNEFNSLSPSSLKTLLNCPLHFLYTKVYNEESFDEYNGEWLKNGNEGNFVHLLFQRYFEKKPILKEKFDEPLFETIFEKTLEEYKNKFPFEDQNVIKYEANKGKYFVKNYLKINLGNEKEKYVVLFTEYSVFPNDFQIKLNNKEYKFNGIIDRIDGYIYDDKLYLRVIDYKTSSPSSFDGDKETQQILYLEMLETIAKKNKSLIEKKLSNQQFKEIDDNPNFTFVLLKNLNKNKMFKRKELTNNLNLILDAYDGLLTLFKSNSFNDCLKLFNLQEKTQINKEMNKNACSYCNYKRHCLLRQKFGEDRSINSFKFSKEEKNDNE